MKIFDLFKKKKVDKVFEYEYFLKQMKFENKRKHYLSEKEVWDLFLGKIDRKDYHVCLSYNPMYGEFIDKYNWDVVVYKMYRDEYGMIDKKYWSKENTAIIDSKYMSEEMLYKNLNELRSDKDE